MTNLPEHLKALEFRLGLTEPQAARYLGVPVTTYRKWRNGTRKPGSVVNRLLVVLLLIEEHSPPIHDALLKDAK